LTENYDENGNFFMDRFFFLLKLVCHRSYLWWPRVRGLLVRVSSASIGDYGAVAFTKTCSCAVFLKWAIDSESGAQKKPLNPCPDEEGGGEAGEIKRRGSVMI
jgi:hypothetical protein